MTQAARLALMTIKRQWPNCAEVLEAELELADDIFHVIAYKLEPSTTKEDVIEIAKQWGEVE